MLRYINAVYAYSTKLLAQQLVSQVAEPHALCVWVLLDLIFFPEGFTDICIRRVTLR